MNGHYQYPGRIENQAIMLADLRLRELHELAAERRLAVRAAAAAQPAQPRRLRLPTWLGLRARPAMQTSMPLAQ